jgi:hypothetical protein
VSDYYWLKNASGLIKIMKRFSIIAVFLSIIICNLAHSQAVNHWETAVFSSDTWKYFVGTSEPDPDWRSVTFNDQDWAQGPGGFGYGDNDDYTIIAQCTSVFLRVKFNASDTSQIAEAMLSMDYDDAFVAYLNDVEIARAGITGLHPAFNEVGIDHEAKMYAGGMPESFYIDKTLLKACLLPGENILAIQVHNSSLTSTDLSSIAYLSFGILNSDHYFRSVPYWLSSTLALTSSNLPIIIINTDGGVPIPDDPRTHAEMKVIYRGEGLRNYVRDQDSAKYLNYNGRISIEVRGSSSQAVLKKQFGFTTLKDDNITNNDVALLGMPEENDWILNGLAFEPSFIRDYINYNLSRMIGEYASRTAFCEVIINGSYNGLYVLQEKVKQGSGRVNVMNIGTTDNSFPELSGGYITKADKIAGGDVLAWTMSSYLGTDDVTYVHVQPKPETVTSAQNTYIRSEFFRLSSTVHNNDASFETGFPSVIDIPSFVDFMIINELSANADAYQFSTYFHKDRNGKLRAGPIWDLNLSYGNDLSIWGYDRSKYNTWQFSNGDNEGAQFWRDLYNNPKFRCCLLNRWSQLIQPGQPLNPDVLKAFIDQTVSTISEAIVREDSRWGNVPNLPAEIDKIKSFIDQRVPWITSTINAGTACSNVEIPKLVITKIMYNPDTTFAFPKANDQEFIEIKNTGNTTVNLSGVYFSGTGFVYQFPSSAQILPDATKLLASDIAVFRARYGVSASGQFTRNLSNNGENLVLADGFGNVIDNVKYSNLPPWPDADGNGNYLQLIDPLSDNNVGTNWTASSLKLVSVNDVEDTQWLKLYPSPVTDNLIIESDGRKYSVQIYDLQGHMLNTSKVNSDTYIFDMTSYPQGMYLVKVTSPGGCFVRKIIKI